MRALSIRTERGNGEWEIEVGWFKVRVGTVWKRTCVKSRSGESSVDCLEGGCPGQSLLIWRYGSMPAMEN